MEITFTSLALVDLEAIHSYIAEDSQDRAQTFVERIRERCMLLATTPLMGALRPEFGESVRSLPVRPVVVFYRVGSEVQILRVIDGRRDLRTVFSE